MRVLEFYIDDLRFPVAIEEVDVKSGSDIKTISLVKKGEIGLWGGEKLDSISFEARLPSSDRSYCQYSNIPTPETFKNHLKQAKKEGTPVRFIMTETDINDLYLVETCDQKYKINARGDIYLNISLIQYIEPEVPQIQGATNNPTKVDKPKRPTDKKDKESKKVRTHIVKRGDTLWGLAKKYYGNGNQYNKIYNANKDKIKNPNLIIDGWKLVIP